MSGEYPYGLACDGGGGGLDITGADGTLVRIGVCWGGGIWGAGVCAGCCLTALDSVEGAGEPTFFIGGGVETLTFSSTLTVTSGVAVARTLELLGLCFAAGAEGARSKEFFFGRPTLSLMG